jgi:hypothetical protein
MTAGTINPWPLTLKGDQQHPVKTLQYLLRPNCLRLQPRTPVRHGEGGLVA